ncbi:hypothetical protein CEUSTIGMA_g7241.t1 [Chlamydomonas eustigma]|uniref:PX domain-containing protein n=1 Tax=Chlamydomonas eustigma TaxID=1157962 RepID=A0A250X9N8_9CHLO|nr:hypothetical protein CEUSTIGMA_g7241.t1 [Chlamydomonas eustigma]|eukprot:GAX79801.1 hypothetical protein CEUSTIGMA_g7241.t1 [Chlamydomonas eustigma]
MSWQFTVSIPQWIQMKDSEGEPITVYRVNVILQGPSDASSGPAKSPHFVLRRYNQFRLLYEQLKVQFPEIMKEKGLSPPPKHALHIRGQKEMQDQRKEELERWLWRLFSKPELATSSALKGFLEIERAVARLQQSRTVGALDASPPQASGVRSQAISVGGGETAPSGSDQGDWDDSRSEVSAVSSMAPGSNVMMFTHLNAVPNTFHHGGQQAPHASVVSEGVVSSSASPSTAVMRLGLRLASRGDVRRLVDVLEQRIAAAGRDLQAAVSEIQLLTETNKMVCQRVVELEGQLQGGRSTREVALERQVEELKTAYKAAMDSGPAGNSELEDILSRLEASEDIRMEVCSRLADAESRLAEADAQLMQATSRAEVHELRSQALEAELRQAQAGLADLESISAGRVAMLNQQISSLHQQLSDAQTENKELLCKLRDWGMDSQLTSYSKNGESRDSFTTPSTSSQQQLQQAGTSADAGELEAALSRATVAESRVQELEQKVLSDKEKVRANQVLLAKEIKKLRAELDAATQAQSDVELQQQQQQQNEILISQGEEAVWVSKMKTLEEQVTTLQVALESANTQQQRDAVLLAEGQQVLLEATCRTEQLGMDMRVQSSRAEQLETELKSEKMRAEKLENDLEEWQLKVAFLSSEVEQAREELRQGPAAFEAEKSAAIQQAGAAGRVMELQQLLAGAKAELQVSEQRQAALEADLGQQLHHARKMLADKEMELADLASRLEESRAAAAVAAAGREAELCAQVSAMEMQLRELAAAAAARAEQGAKMEKSCSLYVKQAQEEVQQVLAELQASKEKRQYLESEVETLRAHIEQQQQQQQQQKVITSPTDDAAEDFCTPSIGYQVAVTTDSLADEHAENKTRLELEVSSLQSHVQEKEASYRALVQQIIQVEAQLAAAQMQGLGKEEEGGLASIGRDTASALDEQEPSSLQLDSSGNPARVMCLNEYQINPEGSSQALLVQVVERDEEIKSLQQQLQEAKALLEHQEKQAESLRQQLQEAQTVLGQQEKHAESLQQRLIGMEAQGQQLQEARQLLEKQDMDLRALQQRLSLLMTVEQQCEVLREQMEAVQKLQAAVEQQVSTVPQQGQHSQGLHAAPGTLVHAASAGLSPYQDLLSLEDPGSAILDPNGALPSAAFTSVSAHSLTPATAEKMHSEEDLLLDLTGLMLSESPPHPNPLEATSSFATAATAAAAAAAVKALEADIEGVISSAITEANGLLLDLKEAEKKAMKLVQDLSGRGSDVGGNGDDSVEVLLAGFSGIGEVLQRVQGGTVGLRQPSLLAPGSTTVRFSEQVLRAGLADALEELVARGVSLNDARCDRLLAELMSEDCTTLATSHPAAAAAGTAPSSMGASTPRFTTGLGSLFAPVSSTLLPQAGARPEATTFPAGSRYQPPVFTGHDASTPAAAAASGGAKVLSALGQRMTEAVSSHWTGLNSALTGAAHPATSGATSRSANSNASFRPASLGNVPRPEQGGG